MPELLRLSRSAVEALTGMQRQLIRALERDALLAARVERLASIPGVGRVVALTSRSHRWLHRCRGSRAQLRGETVGNVRQATAGVVPGRAVVVS